MIVKKTYGIVIILALVGIGASAYYVTKSTRSPSQTVQDRQNHNITTVADDRVLPTRKEFTREELVTAEWPLDYKTIKLFDDWKRFGDYEMKLDEKTFPHDNVLIRKVDSQQEVARFSASGAFFPPSPDKVERNERWENVASVEIIVNPQLEKLYAFFTFGNSHGGGFRKVYKSNLFGQNAQELKLEQGEYTFPESYRFSPDYTTLGYAAGETESVLTSMDGSPTGPMYWEIVGNIKIYFHIIDLFDPSRSIKFLIPRVSSRSDNNNWVAAWRFADENTVEFTRYFARGNEVDGYTQISDKELWQYNKQNDKNTLITTIPFVSVDP